MLKNLISKLYPHVDLSIKFISHRKDILSEIELVNCIESKSVLLELFTFIESHLDCEDSFKSEPYLLLFKLSAYLLL